MSESVFIELVSLVSIGRYRLGFADVASRCCGRRRMERVLVSRHGLLLFEIAMVFGASACTPRNLGTDTLVVVEGVRHL